MAADQYIIEAAKGVGLSWDAAIVRQIAVDPTSNGYYLASAILFAAEVLEREAAKDAEIARLREDKARLDWLQSEMNDVRWVSGHGTEMCSPSDEVGVRIVSHHMAEPRERVEAENWNEDLRGAIDEARQDLGGTDHG